MPDPVMVTVATALVSWATTAVADQARAATTALVTFLRERFAGDTSRQVVDAALSQAGDRRAAERLAALLEQEANRDPAFAQRFRVLWDRAADAVGGTDTGPVNQVFGDVSGAVIQARDVQGGISLGTTHAPPPRP